MYADKKVLNFLLSTVIYNNTVAIRETNFSGHSGSGIVKTQQQQIKKE